MRTYNIFTNEPDSLPMGRADFLLAASVTKTCEIEGITDMTPLTPTLDAEFITNGKVFSLPALVETPNGVPTPAIITRAVHNLVPFSAIEILDLGLVKLPQNSTYRSFGILPSDTIALGANIDARLIFNKGFAYGESYELKGNYLILGESTSTATTTATATALALSFVDDEMSNFEKLSHVSDNMLLFCAGFLMSASRRFHIVLTGGTQMATCLLVADKLREDVLMRVKDENITLATTEWVANDKNSDIAHILSLLSYKPHAICTTFSFKDATILVLKKYDNGEAKEGVGVGAALAYGCTNGVDNAKLLDQIEYILYSI